jgi:hypothetical protein
MSTPKDRSLFLASFLALMGKNWEHKSAVDGVWLNRARAARVVDRALDSGPDE